MSATDWALMLAIAIAALWALMLAIAIAALGVSALVSIYLGMAMDATGSDDRDNTKPADLWQGHERRKIKPYE